MFLVCFFQIRVQISVSVSPLVATKSKQWINQSTITIIIYHDSINVLRTSMKIDIFFTSTSPPLPSSFLSSRSNASRSGRNSGVMELINQLQKPLEMFDIGIGCRGDAPCPCTMFRGSRPHVHRPLAICSFWRWRCMQVCLELECLPPPSAVYLLAGPVGFKSDAVATVAVLARARSPTAPRIPHLARPKEQSKTSTENV